MIVIGVAIDDARAVLVALADPETLYVFGVIAARTSMLGVSGSCLSSWPIQRLGARSRSKWVETVWRCEC